MSKYSGNDSGASCVVYVIMFFVFSLIGGCSFDYNLNALVGKDVPFALDVLGAWVTGQLTIGVTVILWILEVSGVVFPLFHLN